MYDNRVNTNFQAKKVPKGDSSYNCLSLIMSDLLLRLEKSIIHKYFWKNAYMLKEKIR